MVTSSIGSWMTWQPAVRAAPDRVIGLSGGHICDHPDNRSLAAFRGRRDLRPRGGIVGDHDGAGQVVVAAPGRLAEPSPGRSVGEAIRAYSLGGVYGRHAAEHDVCGQCDLGPSGQWRSDGPSLLGY